MLLHIVMNYCRSNLTYTLIKYFVKSNSRSQLQKNVSIFSYIYFFSLYRNMCRFYVMHNSFVVVVVFCFPQILMPINKDCSHPAVKQLSNVCFLQYNVIFFSCLSSSSSGTSEKDGKQLGVHRPWTMQLNRVSITAPPIQYFLTVIKKHSFMMVPVYGVF